MHFLRKSVASMVIVAMLTLGLAPVAQAQEKHKTRDTILAAGVLAFMGATLYTGHKNKKDIVNLRYEAMADRRTAQSGLTRTNARLNAIIESMEKRQRAGRDVGGEADAAVFTPEPLTPTPRATTHEVVVENLNAEEVFLRNIVKDGAEEKLEWPIPAGQTRDIILKAGMTAESLFAVNSKGELMNLSVIHEEHSRIIIDGPTG